MRPLSEQSTTAALPPVQSVLDAVPMSMAVLDAAGIIVAVNQAWQAFGQVNDAYGTPPVGINYLHVCDRASGEDGPCARNAAAGIRAVLAGQPHFSLDYPCHSPHQHRWFELSVSRLEHDGEAYAIVAHLDITERMLLAQERQGLLAKAALDRQRLEAQEQRQALLVRELHHRVRNNLAVIQAMAATTARAAESIEGFSQAITARIAALAKVHALLSDDYWQTASLEAVLKAELKTFIAGKHPRVSLTGAPVDLSADLAVPLGMALHELAVNAVRHGALSIRTGGVSVMWEVIAPQGRRKLRLTWSEHDGPLLQAPARRSFGLVLLQEVLPKQCSAKVEVTFEPKGLRAVIETPLIEHRHVPLY